MCSFCFLYTSLLKGVQRGLETLKRKINQYVQKQTNMHYKSCVIRFKSFTWKQGSMDTNLEDGHEIGQPLEHIPETEDIDASEVERNKEKT